jgi:hypothetical protein
MSNSIINGSDLLNLLSTKSGEGLAAMRESPPPLATGCRVEHLRRHRLPDLSKKLTYQCEGK